MTDINAALAVDLRRRSAGGNHTPPVDATEQAAMKVLYLVATTRRPNRADLIGKTNGWKQILNALTIHYGEHLAINL
jgi:hypothetical protein